MAFGALLSLRRPRISVYLALSFAAALAGAVGLEIAVRAGAWQVRTARPLSGTPAVRMAKLGMGLAAIVGACGVAFGMTACWFASRVLACAARNL